MSSRVVLNVGLLVSALLLAPGIAPAQGPGGGPGGGPPPPPELPDMPEPDENPVTEEKAILGKILFWDVQLSSDDTVSCGSCHSAAAGGSDTRFHEKSIHPGFDEDLDTDDDIVGSLGIERQDCDGELVEDEIFDYARQVTGRKTPSHIMAGYSTTLFWDGRADEEFVDPETGETLIEERGALESQALDPILSSVEMACEDRTWLDVTEKLEDAIPMEFAIELTEDMDDAIEDLVDYPGLFEDAFGDEEITPARIAYAIATYERTLIPDDAPVDNEPGALTAAQRRGSGVFRQNCLPCHSGGEFSDHSFRNIGVTDEDEDPGRYEITDDEDDIGRFRVPSLRNVSLRAPYFHDGSHETIRDVIEFYNDGGGDNDNQAPRLDNIDMSDNQLDDLEDFLENGLLDDRVRDQLPPFDEPVLRRYFSRGDSNMDGAMSLADVLELLFYLYADGEAPECPDAADTNDDGALDIVDAIRTLSRMFSDGEEFPSPSDLSIGPDPTIDDLLCGESND